MGKNKRVRRLQKGFEKYSTTHSTLSKPPFGFKALPRVGRAFSFQHLPLLTFIPNF